MELRLEKGWSRVELSRRAGLSRITVWKIETNRARLTSLESARSLADAFDITLDELVFGEPATTQ